MSIFFVYKLVTMSNNHIYLELCYFIDKLCTKLAIDPNIYHIKVMGKINVNMSIKENIIRCFKILIDKVYAEEPNASNFKARQYSDTIKAFADYDGQVLDLNTAVQVLHNSGKKNPKQTIAKIKEIIETGTLLVVEKALQSGVVRAVSNLTKIYGIGNKKAISLYNSHKIETVVELKNEYGKDNTIINSKQAIGLIYYEDLLQRIPRSEMLEYEQMLMTHANQYDPTINLSINGSFRRGETTSGDIDVLITSIGDITQKRKGFIEYLRKKGIIKETLANGKKKFMGISVLPGVNIYRHIDIIETSLDTYPFGILYFTGSGGFNSMMRCKCLQKGFSLNEYCFSYKNTKAPIDNKDIYTKLGKYTFESEKDIFDFIDMDYVEPGDRNNITLGKV